MNPDLPRHDLDLPPWGPYTKKYLGISHVADQARGLRFDLSVFPGIYRRRNDVPRVTWESAYHPWEASADLEYFSHRHELEWKDRLYADISFSRIDDSCRLVRCELVNATQLTQSFTLHLMASLHFPPLETYSEEPVEPARVEVPIDVRWVHALDYQNLSFARVRPQDNLTYDGQYKGEARAHGFVDGALLGKDFGRDRGDSVLWSVRVDRPLVRGGLLFRYRLPENAWLNLRFEGLHNALVRLHGSGEIDTVVLPLGAVAPGDHELRITSEGGVALETDGFAWGEAGPLTEVRFPRVRWNPVPVAGPGPTDRSLVLKYTDAPATYGLAWSPDEYDLRTFRTAELDRYLRHEVHEHVKRQFRTDGDEHFTNVFLRPLTVEAGQTRVVYALVVSGTPQEVISRLAGGIPEDAEEVWKASRAKAIRHPQTGPGAPFAFSQDRMAATLLTNVVFPIYVRRSYIRHSTPGKWWDCLYTWDSGFIGLGLLELDPARAEENLRAYLTDPGDPHGAFLHHGSPVPVQFSLFSELWNRTQDRALVEFAYPRLRQFYRFLAGHAEGSTTAVLKSGLLKTWDYFYNSGGWDDYPPQVHTHKNRLTATVAPVITSAHAIRMAKILIQAAQGLGESDDLVGYRADISRWTDALQRHSWDAESGYFGYVVHDEDGQPLQILRHETGENFNRGLDGMYPLFAGICTPEQEARAREALTSTRHLWSGVGLSTVDQAAPYYRNDGYWNGAVWMAHQWFFWKTALDLGWDDVAWQIAQTALEIWKRETDETYCCMEHWVIESGRGAGWHQFGGLSSPVLSWYGAYYVPGRVSTGYDLRVVSRWDLRGDETLEADLEYFGDRPRMSAVVVVLEPGMTYRATWNGAPVETRPAAEGAWSILLPVAPGTGRLAVRRV